MVVCVPHTLKTVHLTVCTSPQCEEEWRQSQEEDFTVKLSQDTLTQHANRNQVKTQRNSDGEPELKICHLQSQLKHMM